MPTATPAGVRRQIRAGAPDAVYLLLGEDEIEKSALANEFADLIEEGLHAFNVDRIHAGDWNTGDRLAAGVAALIATARTLPLMAPRRVVLVLHAEALLAPKRESDAASRALDRFESLLQEPEAQTTLVLVATAVDKRSRLYKLLARRATLVECGAIETLADAERWVRNRVAAAGAEIAPSAARLLAERSGTDLVRLRNDADRLLLFTLGQKTIGVGEVRDIAGPAALQDDWAMANAIEACDGAGALRQLALMLEAGEAPEKILGQLGWLVRTKFPMLRPGSVRGAVDALFRTDQDLKRSAGDPRVLLERLVVELSERTRPGGRPTNGPPGAR
jgi:DNA polymerase III delta subunit